VRLGKTLEAPGPQAWLTTPTPSRQTPNAKCSTSQTILTVSKIAIARLTSPADAQCRSGRLGLLKSRVHSMIDLPRFVIVSRAESSSTSTWAAASGYFPISRAMSHTCDITRTLHAIGARCRDTDVPGLPHVFYGWPSGMMNIPMRCSSSHNEHLSNT
jgi:hypothetical protein